MFILYKGRLTIRLRSGDVELEEGDMFVIPKGVEHAPRADEEVELMILGLDVTSNEAGGKPVSCRALPPSVGTTSSGGLRDSPIRSGRQSG
ncbi:MAG: cupin domain-containing protein [Acidobacteria bacterium]|nr:cupin domain-containing protein [Acidobacteriota bacterium]